MDPANYHYGIVRGFDITQDRAHPPGYPFFIYGWRALYLLTSVDPHTLVIMTNMMWAACTAVFTYLLAKRLYGPDIALYASVLAVLNPVLIYYASTGEIYAYDAAFSSFAVYALIASNKRSAPFVVFLLGAAGGFRLSAVVLLFPLVVTVFFVRRKELIPSVQYILKVIFAFGLGTIAWFMPIVLAHGGIANALSLVFRSTDLRSQIVQFTASYGTILFWMTNFGAFIILPWLPGLIRRFSLRSWHSLLITAWLVPPSLFFMVKHYAKGYALLLLPAMAIIIARCIYSDRNVFRRRMLLGLCIATGLCIFFFLPYGKLPLEASRSKEKRTASERIGTQLIRAVSVFAPSFAHLRVSDGSLVSTSDSILIHSHPGSVILVDPSATLWAYPRSLEIRSEDRYYLTPEPGDSLHFRLFNRSDFRKDFTWEEFARSQEIVLVSDERNVGFYTTELGIAPVSIGEFTTLFRVDREKLSALRHAFSVQYYE
jgi:hypothetical protein